MKQMTFADAEYASKCKQTREWEKDGVKHYTTEIVVDMNGTLQLLGGRGGNNEGGGEYAPRQQQSRPAPQSAAQQPAQDFDSFDDDIPF